MEVNEILRILQEDMKVAVIATADAFGQPHARHAHIGVANEEGVFFMTSPITNFYKQLEVNPKVAITAMKEDGYLIQVIRLEGKVRRIGKERLQEVLKDNPYVDQVYPDDNLRQGMQVFQLYSGEGFYHSMSQGHKYVFSIGHEENADT